MTLRRLRALAGLAAAVVPCAIVVHLVAEAAAIGRDRLDASFLIRHAYFALLLVGSVFWFGSTVGLGRPASERRRRSGLLRADLRALPRYGRLSVLGCANLVFFALTQALEGVPIASGSFLFGLGVALTGSALAALLVFFFGRSIAACALESVLATSPIGRSLPHFAHRVRIIVAPRDASTSYNLFVPNRPPPIVSRF